MTTTEPDSDDARRLKLQVHPLCEACLARTHITLATKVFRWADTGSYATGVLSLCEACYEAKSKADDPLADLPYQSDVGIDGLPVDRRHPIYTGDYTHLDWRRS